LFSVVEFVVTVLRWNMVFIVCF